MAFHNDSFLAVQKSHFHYAYFPKSAGLLKSLGDHHLKSFKWQSNLIKTLETGAIGKLWHKQLSNSQKRS